MTGPKRVTEIQLTANRSNAMISKMPPASCRPSMPWSNTPATRPPCRAGSTAPSRAWSASTASAAPASAAARPLPRPSTSMSPASSYPILKAEGGGKFRNKPILQSL